MRSVFVLPLVTFMILVGMFVVRLIAVKEGDVPSRLQSVLIGQPVPSFALPALLDRERPLRSEDLKGQVSLVNIFGSWCIACLIEHPFLMALKESSIVPIHGINWRDDPEKGAAWLRYHGDPYSRVGVDRDSRVAIDFGVSGAPEMFVVDAGGVIRFKHIGPLTPDVWKETLAPLIKRLQVEEP